LSPEAKQLAGELSLNSEDLVRIVNRVAEAAGAVHTPNIEYDSDPDCPGDRYFRLRIVVKRGSYPLMQTAAAAARKALREAVPLAKLEFFRIAICLE
jgi:hypothetical protein